MGNNIKQVYASVQFINSELRLLVGEYYNTRFNITKFYRTNCDGLGDFEIIDRDLVKKTLNDSVLEVSKKLGAKIEKLILVLPTYNFKRIPLKININPDTGVLSQKDVLRAVKIALSSSVDDDLLVTNASIIKYSINGISTRHLPENEVCDECTVDIDLLCANKAMIYDFVSLIEESGLQVVDITLDAYAICKEGAFFEQSLKNNLILLDVEYGYTSLALLNKGKLVSVEILDEGLGRFVDIVFTKYHLPKENILRLVKYNVNKDYDYPDDAIFAWSHDDKNYSISTGELTSLLEDPINDYAERVAEMCKPILEAGETTFVLVGEGAAMNALALALKDKINQDVKVYNPDTIGVRDSSLAAIYGSFFVYREMANLRGINVDCLDLSEYESVVDRRTVDVEGETITSRIKSLFERYRNKGDE